MPKSGSVTLGQQIGPGAGVIALLVAATALLSVAPFWLPESYSWLQDGTSESAAQGVQGAWVARAGFVAFGLAVLWLAWLSLPRWGWAGTALHTAFGVGMLGVAAFSHRPWIADAPFDASEDRVHSVFATMVGVAFIAGVVAVVIARRSHSWRSTLPDLLVLLIAAVVPLAMESGVWGILQRVMFLAAACWYAREARRLRTGTGPAC